MASIAPPSTTGAAARGAPEAPAEIRAIAPGPVALGAAPVRVPLRSPAAALRGVPPAGPLALPAADKDYYLVLQGIKVEAPPGAATYNVFFDLPEGAPAPSVDDPTYVGTLNFFGVQPGHDHGRSAGKGHKAAFNATEAVRRLKAAGKLSGSPTVTLVPRGEGHGRARPTVAELSLVEG